jgi:hypothetical protein
MQAQILSMISLPPTIILNGVLLYGLLQGANIPTATLCIVQSMAQCGVFMFISSRASYARRLLQIATDCRAINEAVKVQIPAGEV